MISKLTAQYDKETHVLYHYHYFIIICIHTLQADPVRECDASIDLTREDAIPLGPALDASFELTRRFANDVENHCRKVVSVKKLI